jgi:hypothetical protein
MKRAGFGEMGLAFADQTDLVSLNSLNAGLMVVKVHTRYTF